MLYLSVPFKRLLQGTILAGVLVAHTAQAQTVGNMIITTGAQSAGLPKFAAGIFYIMGIFFMVRGVYGLYEFGKDSKAKWQHALATLFLGGFLTMFPVAYKWTTNTLFGTGGAAAPALSTMPVANLSVFRP